MAVSFADGVVVGADSRTTTGSYIGMFRWIDLYLIINTLAATVPSSSSQQSHR